MVFYFLFIIYYINGGIILLFKVKINKRYMYDQKLNKISEDQLLRELRILRKQLLKVDE